MLTVLSIILGVMLIVGGFTCLILPELTFMTLGYIIGVAMIMDGIGMIVAWLQRDRRRKGNGWVLASGIISLLFGIVLVGNGFLQLAVEDFIVYAAIAWMFIVGIFRIVLAFQIRSLYKQEQQVNRNTQLGRDWWIGLILGILMILCAIICLFFPVAVVQTIGIMIGIGIIINGVDLIHFGTTAWLPI